MGEVHGLGPVAANTVKVISQSKASNLIRRNPKKSATLAAILALAAVTASKDNVHFGSVELNNPQENQYIWGLMPNNVIKGDVKGNIYSFGGFSSQNTFKNNNSIQGNISSIGFAYAGNDLKNTAVSGNISSNSLIMSLNEYYDNCRVEGDISSYALLGSVIRPASGSLTVTGNVDGKGLLGNIFGEAFFLSSQRINLVDYTISK